MRISTRSLVGIKGVASIHVGAGGVCVLVALADDSWFTVKAFLERQKHSETQAASKRRAKRKRQIRGK